MAEILAGRADITVFIDHGRPAASGIQVAHLQDDPYLTALTRGHDLSRKRVLELGDHPWVDAAFLPNCCRGIVTDACAGFSPNFVVEASDYPTAQGFVAASIGVTIAPRLGLGTTYPGVVVRPLRRPEPLRRIRAAFLEAGVKPGLCRVPGRTERGGGPR